MPRNTEIKLRLNGDLRYSEISNRLVGILGAAGVRVIAQRDHYYNGSGSRRLKLRQEWDPVHEAATKRGCLIGYERADSEDVRCSNYQKCDVADIARMLEVLNIGLGSVECVVSKRRTVGIIGQTRVHLDVVYELNNAQFLELEVMLDDGQSHEQGTVIAHQVLEQLGVSEHESRRNAIRGSYREMVLMLKDT